MISLPCQFLPLRKPIFYAGAPRPLRYAVRVYIIPHKGKFPCRFMYVLFLVLLPNPAIFYHSLPIPVWQAGAPPRAESRVSMRATIISKIIRGRKKPLSAAFFETASINQSTEHNPPPSLNPALKLGSAFSRTVQGAGRRGSYHYAQELQSRTSEKRNMEQ